MKEKEVEVLLVQPEKYPKKVSISRGLESLQKMVGGYISFTYPFKEDVGIVLNDDDISSLSPELMDKFERLFHKPEVVTKVGGYLMISQIESEN